MRTNDPLALTTRSDLLAVLPPSTAAPFVTRLRLGSLLLAAAAVTCLLPAYAQAEVQIAITVGPPVARVEKAPAPRSGMIWIPGYWDWQRHRHVWIEGRWERSRPGYRWERSQWVSHNGRWILVRGYWARVHSTSHRDRDRDNDGIRNARDRDRDGDGVPNRRDRRPDNSRRR